MYINNLEVKQMMNKHSLQDVLITDNLYSETMGFPLIL